MIADTDVSAGHRARAGLHVAWPATVPHSDVEKKSGRHRKQGDSGEGLARPTDLCTAGNSFVMRSELVLRVVTQACVARGDMRSVKADGAFG